RFVAAWIALHERKSGHARAVPA
ncbi:MAG: hypothetical protein K0S35_3449, partial [Geminicoccaceae bacterium]|nr:hypothetical protein [Geminicoccaceae bacterium]